MMALNENQMGILKDLGFIKDIQGQAFIRYTGLIFLVERWHPDYSLKAKVTHFYPEHNTVICEATVSSRQKRVGNGDEKTIVTTPPRECTAIGDASLTIKGNVRGPVMPHFIRIAGTRAKARALRDFMGITMVCVSEMTIDGGE
jgi:hypothetical protein